MSGQKGKNGIRICMTVCSVIVGFLGLGILLYPAISRYYYHSVQEQMIESYQNSIQGYGTSQYDEMLLKAAEYNTYLSENHISPDNIETERKHLVSEGLVYNDILDPEGNGIIGYLTIDRIHVKLPISHGADQDVLKKGIGHLEGTSFPIEGDCVHAVLSAHRGLPSSVLFSDLDEIEEGDTFEIHIADRIFRYCVDQILVVLPEDTSALCIEDNRNYVTLVTCTPYGVNTHRLLVRGALVERLRGE